MKAPIRLSERDPRNPRKALLAIVLTLLILGWFLWVLDEAERRVAVGRTLSCKRWTSSA
jgi:hypothetical protein